MAKKEKPWDEDEFQAENLVTESFRKTPEFRAQVQIAKKDLKATKKKISKRVSKKRVSKKNGPKNK